MLHLLLVYRAISFTDVGMMQTVNAMMDMCLYCYVAMFCEVGCGYIRITKKGKVLSMRESRIY